MSHATQVAAGGCWGSVCWVAVGLMLVERGAGRGPGNSHGLGRQGGLGFSLARGWHGCRHVVAGIGEAFAGLLVGECLLLWAGGRNSHEKGEAPLVLGKRFLGFLVGGGRAGPSLPRKLIAVD